MAERLVEVQVAHVGADVAGPAQAHLRVHIGAIHVDLAAVLMDDLADPFDRRFEHAVRRRIGHHQRSERGGVLFRLGLEIRDVDVAVLVGLHHHDLHTGHDRAGGIVPCADCGIRQVVRCAFAAVLVVRTNHEQPGKLPLRAGIGLQRHLREAGDLSEQPSSCRTAWRSPAPAARGAKGCRRLKPRHVIGIISVVALSFIVQEPSGIIAAVKDRSRSSSRLR